MHEIEPRVSVDGIPFGTATSLLMRSGYVEDLNAYDSITKWRTFKKNKDVDIYVKDDAVVCAACFFNCTVDGVSLIGTTSSHIEKILGKPDEVGEEIWVSNDRQQIPYEYFSLGLQIWFESGKVVSVFCNDAY